MEGCLKQFINKEGEEMHLIWCPVDIEEGIFQVAYENYLNDDEGPNDYSFDDWWNMRNEVQIKRVWTDIVYITT